MSFEVSPAAYDRYMGRFSVPLAVDFADYAETRPGERILDVGCGPGALTAALAARGADVAGVDASTAFVVAARERLPGVDVRAAVAEALPFDDATFDRTLAQLAVHFFSDPVAGLREMGRVTRPGGLVAACVWDLEARETPLALFWAAAKRVDPSAPGEAWRAGTREGQLGELMRSAGLGEVEESALAVSTTFDSFEDWWDPFTLGVGPGGQYVQGLDTEGRARLRAECRASLPDGSFTQRAPAWVARGQA